MRQIHSEVMRISQEIKKKINTKEFCELHAISESKFSRFPSKKFIEDLILYDYMVQFYKFKK